MLASALSGPVPGRAPSPSIYFCFTLLSLIAVLDFVWVFILLLLLSYSLCDDLFPYRLQIFCCRAFIRDEQANLV